MTQRISISRAARLVGVKRGVLQQKVRTGDLKTFEGEIALDDLIEVYPDAQIEDLSMLEKVSLIMEQSSYFTIATLPKMGGNQALASRILTMSKELSEKRNSAKQYRILIEGVNRRLEEMSGAKNLDAATETEIRRLLQWVSETEAQILTPPLDDDSDSLANEVYLKIMTAQATVQPSGHEFFVEGSDSILEAGLRGGLGLNYGCSNGNCGLCKIRVISGDTRRTQHQDYFLTEAEKNQGFVLACCNTAVTDIVLEADEARYVSDIPDQNIVTRIKKIEVRNDEIILLSTQTPRTNRLRFLAGQQATLEVAENEQQAYAIASCPCDDRNLQFHIPVEPENSFTEYLLTSAKNNDSINIKGPTGDFVLDEDSPNSLVFIAEDSGFASIKGLIEHAMALDSAELIYLFWVHHSENGPYLHNLCRAWNDALDNFGYYHFPVSDQENIHDIVLQSMLQQGLSFQNLDFYISASQTCADNLEQSLISDGVAIKQIHLNCQ
jgi:CDP-4-dehydro-6-deoxyglucose reductase